LSEQLGAEAYDAYRRKVPMLVSFGPRPAWSTGAQGQQPRVGWC